MYLCDPSQEGIFWIVADAVHGSLFRFKFVAYVDLMFRGFGTVLGAIEV